MQKCAKIHILHIFRGYFFNFEINEYFHFYFFFIIIIIIFCWGGGVGMGVAMEVILEDFIGEIV